MTLLKLFYTVHACEKSSCLGRKKNKNRSIKNAQLMKNSPNLVRCSLFAAFAVPT